MTDGTLQMILGQVLDCVFRLVRVYWRLLLGIAIFPTAVVSVPMFAAMGTALAIIYHDQRWRKEGVFPSALPV